MIVVVFLLGIALALAVYAVFVERNWFAVRVHVVPCLPAGARPLRALHISDLHLTRAQRRKQLFVRSLARLQPDLVLATGDLLGDHMSAAATTEAVGPLRGRLGSFLVLGSNDYYGPKFKNPIRYFIPARERERKHGTINPWPEMVAGLQARGWNLLHNQTARAGDIDVLGLGDAHIGLADISVATERVHEGFRLAVAHSPDVARALAGLGYDLIVSGHTHGGQVCIPGYGALLTNCDLPREMAKGVHQIEGAWLHVCAGLGTSKFAPYRFACRPEVCVLELVPRA